MAFFVGQKVVCVNAGPLDDSIHQRIPWANGEGPREGAIYTVISCHNDDFECPVLWLAEIKRHRHSVVKWGKRVGYDVRRFRPVTDISDLAAIVRETLAGKQRQIAPDQFDKLRVQ